MAARDARVRGKPLEVRRRIAEGNAAIAGRMPMAAFEAVARIAEQQRAGGEQLTSCRCPVAERTGDHHRDAHARVAFLERLVAWAEGAKDVRDVPARALGQRTRACAAARAFSRALRERLLQSDGNFPQDAPRLSPYRGFSTSAANAVLPVPAMALSPNARRSTYDEHAGRHRRPRLSRRLERPGAGRRHRYRP